MFDAVKHGPELCQPLASHSCDALHILLQRGRKGWSAHGWTTAHPQKALPPTHLGGHHKLVVDNVVGGITHAKKRAGGMQVARHPCADVDVFPNALGAEGEESLILAQPNQGPPSLQNVRRDRWTESPVRAIRENLSKAYSK